MRTPIDKHSITCRARRTSISLEPSFWTALRSIAAQRCQTVQQFVEAIDASRGTRNLSSAVRTSILDALLSHIAAIDDRGLKEADALLKMQPIAVPAEQDPIRSEHLVTQIVPLTDDVSRMVVFQIKRKTV